MSTIKVRFKHNYRNDPRGLFYKEGETHELPIAVYRFICLDSHGACEKYVEPKKTVKDAPNKAAKAKVTKSK